MNPAPNDVDEHDPTARTILIPPEIAAAYKEAKARGLPDGWTCTIDKRKRRKWTAPNNGRSCDSIPKAIGISVDMGLLPPDTVIPSGRRNRTKKKSNSQKKKKRPGTTSSGRGPGRPSKKAKQQQNAEAAAAEAAESLLSMVSCGGIATAVNKAANSIAEDDDNNNSDDDDDDDDEGPPPVPMDPESTFDVYNDKDLPVSRGEACLPTTVHWDPTSPDGRKIGWRVKIENGNKQWLNGRVVRYDPHTHKHKILFDNDDYDDDDSNGATSWIWLRNEQHNLQLATRMVWAHVKGYAWWPALVMESNNESAKTKEGYVLIEFFGTGEISCLRDNPEIVRPFHPHEMDPVVAKHRKKRNQRAYQLACEEYRMIRHCRNEAATDYAKAALALSCYYAPKNNSNPTQLAMSSKQHALVGKRVQIFRNDVNYPYGDNVVGWVRQYSLQQKKWLLSFELAQIQSKKEKYPPAWINLYGKEHNVKILDKKTDVTEPAREDLIPFLFGYIAEHSDDTELVDLLKSCCHGCVEYLPLPNHPDPTLTCKICQGRFHLGCVDPPMSLEAWQRMMKDGSEFTCVRCTPCRGCYQKDICFGCHTQPSPPPMLSLPNPEARGGRVSLDLCSMCKVHYDAERFCPNCAHIWDDKKFDIVRRQMEYGPQGGKRKGAGSSSVEDSGSHLYFGHFEGDEVLPLSFKVDPALFNPETSEWGWTEEEMLVCDNCNVWVHAGCAGVTEDEYDVISNGDHSIYSKEFLCRMCCRQRCRDLITALQKEDKIMLFAQPVSEKIVPNYHDLIKEPMDLKTMQEKVEVEEYFNYAWVREMFELMVLNALTFNRYYTDVWREAKRFYHAALDNVFASIGKAAPAGKYEGGIKKAFAKADEAKKKEEERVQVDESVEKKDLVAGTLASVSIDLPNLRDAPPDQESCVPYKLVKMEAIDAFYSSWMDCCFTCGSSGASDTFLFCVDCGEAFHSFCVSAPIHSMAASSVSGWRCPNCKICEISGEVPSDETRMLFCEMCDRGFSLDLLDPPLESAPSGLWICGQCVDCKVCGNSAEKEGASLRYWSQDPNKCFRCGGCDEALEDFPPLSRCQVCSGLLRLHDQDVVECTKCDGKVHASCDERAEEYLRREESKSRAHKMQETLGNSYFCPSCYRPSAQALEDQMKEQDRRNLSEQAWQLITERNVGRHDNYSDAELHGKLVDDIDWAIRDLWRDEYMSIIKDAIRIYCMAKSLGDPRFVIQQVLQRMIQLPDWLGHRALRFSVLAKQRKWDIDGFSSDKADVIVITAKLAAAFIDIVCRTLGINKDKDVSFPERMESLVKPPGEIVGDFVCPFDRIKRSEEAFTTDENGFIAGDADNDKARAANESPRPTKKEARRRGEARHHVYDISKPICGWGSEVTNPSGLTEWKDPRECCLCHLAGDDDAGLPELAPGASHSDRPALGRLLPMPEGYWVHTSCALWSSEVWEDPEDGLIHAVEKARGRGAQLKCFGCGLSGATVGCNKSNCPFNYHFPCAKACGAVFSTDQHVFCASHKPPSESVLEKESIEHMKALMVAPDKQKVGAEKDASDQLEDSLCLRVGSLVVHSFGTIESKVDGFHSENYITPPGYASSRIFWSSRRPRCRTVYLLKVERNTDGQPIFCIIPGDDPTAKISSSSVSLAFSSLMERVRKVNSHHFSQGNVFSRLPVVRRTRRKTYGLNGPQFFGFGLDHVRRKLESCPGVEAVVAPLTPSSPQYRFCFSYGPDPLNSSTLIDLIKDLQRRRAASEAEQALQNSSGCARTEGIKAVVKSGGSGRITRALVRSAEDDTVDKDPSGAANKSEEKAKADKNLVQLKYRQMKAIPIEQRLVARRSHIHGWGLFTLRFIPKYYPVVEYMGEIIRKRVADKRERAYEVSGEGSCYMFRVDLQRIVDATKIGCMARFMNHSCCPNAYAKILSIDTDLGQERKIVVFALRDIAQGEEITYDYKFPVEDGSLRCTCGAPNCIGRLN